MASRPAAARRRQNTRTRRAEARERILAAADELLRDRPFRELTIDELMAQAGLSRTLFYRHFDGLPEVLLALLATIEGELMRPLVADGDRRHDEGWLEEVLGGAVDVFARHGRFLRAVAEAASHDPAIEAAYRAFVEASIETTAALFSADMAAGRMPRHDPRELARALTLMNGAYLLETLGRDAGFDRRLALDSLLAVWHAVVAAPR